MNNERAEIDLIKWGFVTNLNKDPPYLECSILISVEYSSFLKQISKLLYFQVYRIVAGQSQGLKIRGGS